MEDITKTLIEQVSSHGIFALLFVLLGLAVLRFIASGFTKFTAMAEQNINTIVGSNAKFAESSQKMVELLSVLIKQEEFNASQLKFIRKTIQKNNTVNVEIINIIKGILKDDKETSIRLDNLVQEISRPIED
jgi:hypothetical protein